MKNIYSMLFLLSLSLPLGQSFLALSPSRNILAARLFPARPLPSTSSSQNLGHEDEPHEPILLPPADYSKPGSVVNLGDDSAEEIGHVMLNRKMTLSFTCNVCDGHSSYQINRVSFMQGIVVLWCQNCNQKHLIADNLGKLDFPEFGRNLEEFMAKKGTPVKRVVMSKEGLSHVVSDVPGPDYPEINPYLVTQQEEEEGAAGELLPGGFDGTSLLPGAHVGRSSYLPGVPPRGGLGGGGEEEELAGGEDGGDSVNVDETGV